MCIVLLVTCINSEILLLNRTFDDQVRFCFHKIATESLGKGIFKRTRNKMAYSASSPRTTINPRIYELPKS